MLLPLYLLWTAVLFQCNSIPSHFHGRSLRWNLVHVLMYDSCQWESLKCHLWVFSKHALGGPLMTYLMTCLSTMVKLLWGFQGLLCSDLNMTCFPRASQDSTSVVIESFADLPLLPWPQVIQGWLCSLTLLENEALICYLLICSLTKELLLSGWVGGGGGTITEEPSRTLVVKWCRKSVTFQERPEYAWPNQEQREATVKRILIISHTYTEAVFPRPRWWSAVLYSMALGSKATAMQLQHREKLRCC